MSACSSRGRGARRTGDVADDRVHQARLENESDAIGWSYDGLSQAELVQRPEQMLVRSETSRELRVERAACVEVGPHRQYDDAASQWNSGRIEQVCHKLRPLLLVSTLGEDFLELVHDPYEPAGGRLLRKGERYSEMQRAYVTRKARERALHRVGANELEHLGRKRC
jgi:hypothetical protein